MEVRALALGRRVGDRAAPLRRRSRLLLGDVERGRASPSTASRRRSCRTTIRFPPPRACFAGCTSRSRPSAQAKLVRVVRGAIFDVAVDIREGSPTYRRWVGLEVSRERWNQILVPAGFAHGFRHAGSRTPRSSTRCRPPTIRRTRTARCASTTRRSASNGPTRLAPFTLSAKDEAAPPLADVETGFAHEG